jgi:tRNA pseudouridine32 synthase/23S rRNA pseudouridine746 synthase
VEIKAGATVAWREAVTAAGKSPLPIRDGVSPGSVVLPPGHWSSILDFLVERFTFVSRDEIASRMERGDIVDENGTKIHPQQAYAPYRRLYYYRELPPEEAIPFEETVLYQDERIVAVDKPHFLPVNPSGHYLQETLLIRLIRRLGIASLTPMHRLDRETAGVMLFTVEPKFRGIYQELFRRQLITKSYEAVAPFRADLKWPISRHTRLVTGHPFMRMRETTDDESGPANAFTRIEPIEIRSDGLLARYRLNPTSGKKHQLRVHMASLGIPIINDTLYPTMLSQQDVEARGYRSPLQLLARSIAFTDPISGVAREFSSQQELRLDWNLDAPI